MVNGGGLEEEEEEEEGVEKGKAFWSNHYKIDVF